LYFSNIDQNVAQLHIFKQEIAKNNVLMEVFNLMKVFKFLFPIAKLFFKELIW